MKFVIGLIGFVFLTACVMSPNTYRGVPETTWKHLTAEQREMIVDKSFHEQFADQINSTKPTQGRKKSKKSQEVNRA